MRSEAAGNQTVSSVSAFSGASVSVTGVNLTATVSLAPEYGRPYKCGGCREWYHRNVSRYGTCHCMGWERCCHCNDKRWEPDRDAMGNAYDFPETDSIL